MGKYTLQELMAAAGVKKFPGRWAQIFDEAMSEYDAEGCTYAGEGLLYSVNEKYRVFPKYFDKLLEAAEQVRKTEPLGRYTVLLGAAMRNKETMAADLAALEPPCAPESGVGNGSVTGSGIGYDLASALVFPKMIPDLYEDMRRRGVPEKVIYDSFLIVDNSIGAFKKIYGRPGLNNLYLRWSRHIADSSLMRIGRFNFEIFYKFNGRIRVLRNPAGEETALVDGLKLHRSGFALGSPGYQDEEGAYTGTITETDSSLEGYPVIEGGRASDTVIRLPKSEWHTVLQAGNPVINVHIPAAADFSPNTVEQSYKEGMDIISRCYPEFPYRGFVCHSWLMDPQLETMLKDGSNIVSFQRRYRRFPSISSGRGSIYFVFSKPAGFTDFASLPEDTSLMRALKRHYMDGKYIYESGGYFII